MRWSVLWTFLPDEALPLLIVGIGLAIILGLLRGRAALGLLVLLLLAPVLGAVVEPLLAQLPPWVTVLLLAFVGLAILRRLAALFLGPRAADTMVGALAADVVRLAVRLLLLPLLIVGWTVRSRSRDGSAP
jgi:hypothetical protein